MGQGCYLGCLVIEAGVNDQIDITEDPLGVPNTFQTSITAGDYFPDSATAGEDILAVVETATDLAAGFDYSLSISSTDGLVTISSPDGVFDLLTSAGYEDSVFLKLGFPATDPRATTVGGDYFITATTPPTGTWYPKTPDDSVELISDTRWRTHREGRSRQGITGKRYTRKYAVTKTRDLKLGPIVGPTGVSGVPYTNADIDRAITCYEDHWGHGTRIRVYTDTRTIATATNDNNIFDAVLTNEDFDPARFQGLEEMDWWEIVLNFSKYVS